MQQNNVLELGEEQIRNEVCRIICGITELKEELMKDDANFIDDLGIESVMAIDIIEMIEKKFRIEIPEEKYAEIDCLWSTVNLIKEMTANN